MCEFCKEVDYVFGFDNGQGAILDIRFDPDNKELDFMVRLQYCEFAGHIGTVIDQSMKINFCPMCGNRLNEGDKNNVIKNK